MLAIGPYITSMTLGGIRIPRHPAAQIVPVARLLSYPLSSMGLKDIVVRMVTEAAIIPRQAARIVPNNMVLMANPPAIRPNQTYRASYKPALTCDFSRSIPMKINKGTAIIAYIWTNS